MNFVEVSVYVRPDGKKVVHAYGPYETRNQVKAAIDRDKRRLRREHGRARADEVTFHTCEIINVDVMNARLES